MTGWAPSPDVHARAAPAEIGGCFAFWSWARGGAGGCWLLAGMASLALFAWLLTLAGPAAAGRAYAAYGGIYVLAAIGWMLMVERVSATRSDRAGVSLCVAGCLVILVQRRGPPHLPLTRLPHYMGAQMSHPKEKLQYVRP